jgi:prepilin-type N-terminal cleavage/methylation domain-containing protein
METKGFTLIELLIVIAIILILIAIALPNFLEAQTRARVVKVKGDIRSLAIAQESYFLDFQTYPSESEDNPYARGRTTAGLYWLTSPIKYIGAIPNDPFGEQALGDGLTIYETGGIESGRSNMACIQCLKTWVIYSLGPDTPGTEVVSADPHRETYGDGSPGGGSTDAYSATNGTKSRGDIFQYGGDPFWIGVNMGMADLATYKNNPSAYDKGLMVSHQIYLHRLPPVLE